MNVGTEQVHGSLRDRLPLSLSHSLCISCDAAATCGHRVQARQPVWECEEFDPGLTRTVWPPTGSLTTDRAPEPDGRAGLCVNCAERHLCRHPVAEAGVWYCEDHR